MIRGVAFCLLVSSCDTSWQGAIFDYDINNPFVSTWKVKAGDTIRLPLIDAYRSPGQKFNYNFTIDWGDDSTPEAIASPVARHTYDNGGDFTVQIAGQVEAWGFWKAKHSRNKIIEVLELGDTGWKSLTGAFFNCPSLNELNGGDTSEVTDMSYMFAGAELINPDIEGWETSKVTSMRAMFDRASYANPDVSSWNTAQVTDMAGMFHKTLHANPDVSNWVTSKVTSMASMFKKAESADPDVSNWDTAAVVDMSSMFSNAFTSPRAPDARRVPHGIQGWDISQVVSMHAMFKGAVYANPDMSTWNFPNVTYMDLMFEGIKLETGTYSEMLIRIADTTTKQNVILDGGRSLYSTDARESRRVLVEDKNWQISDGGVVSTPPPTTPSSSSFITKWRISGQSESERTVKLPLVEGFNYDFSLDCGNGASIEQITSAQAECVYPSPSEQPYKITINGILEAWDFKKIADSRNKLVAVELGNVGWKSLRNAFYGCQNLTQFKAGYTAGVTDMSYMFAGASKLASIDYSDKGDQWITSQVTDMSGMFSYASEANFDVSDWDTSNVTDMSHIFADTTKANPDVSKWNTSMVTDMSHMFDFARNADPDVSSWNTASVTTMRRMFNGAKKVVNLDTSGWNTANVTDMYGMFSAADTADPVMTSWDFLQVLYMDKMFSGVTISTQNYSDMLVKIKDTAKQKGIKLNGGDSEYNEDGGAARTYLRTSMEWEICDGGREGQGQPECD